MADGSPSAIGPSAVDRSPPNRGWPDRTAAIVATAALAAVAGAFCDATPTGIDLIDSLWCGGFAALIALAAAWSHRGPTLWLAGLPLVVATGWAMAPAMLALALVLVSIALGDDRRVTGAVIGGLAAQSLLRMPPVDHTLLQPFLIAGAVFPVLWSGYRNAPLRMRRTVRRTGAIGAGVVVASIAGLAVAATLAHGDLARGVEEAEAAIDRVESGENVEAGQHFEASADAFRAGEHTLDAVWALPARLLPVLAPNRHAALELARTGREVAASAASTVSTAPYQDLRTDGGRIDLAVVEQMQAPVAGSVAVLRAGAARTRILTSPWLVAPIANAVDDLSRQLAGTLPDAELASRGLVVAPELLGGAGARRYLVLFTNPAETRFLGGFAGAYGILTAVDGELDLVESGTFADLNPETDFTFDLEGLDEFESRYGRYDVIDHLQNVTASPDFPTVAQASMQLVEQATGLGIDGVVAADPVALAGFLQLTGPVEVEGVGTLDGENAADYLLSQQYLTFSDDNEQRRDRLGDAATATFDALTSRDLPDPRSVADSLGPPVAENRLLFWVPGPEEQAFLGDLGLLGSFEPTSGGGDFLSVRNANAGANKIDLFLTRDISYDVSYDPGTGAVDAIATVTLHNQAPDRGLSSYVIGNRRGLEPGSNITMVGLYSPLQVESATIDGEALALEQQQELGARVYSAIVVVPSGGSLTITYELSGNLPPGDTYRLDLFHQPLVDHDNLAVEITSASETWAIGDIQGLPADGSTFPAEHTVSAVFEGR